MPAPHYFSFSNVDTKQMRPFGSSAVSKIIPTSLWATLQKIRSDFGFSARPDARFGAEGLKGWPWRINRYREMAGGPGFEPGLSGSEPLVLPLNYPPPGLHRAHNGPDRRAVMGSFPAGMAFSISWAI